MPVVYLARERRNKSEPEPGLYYKKDENKKNCQRMLRSVINGESISFGVFTPRRLPNWQSASAFSRWILYNIRLELKNSVYLLEYFIIFVFFSLPDFHGHWLCWWLVSSCSSSPNEWISFGSRWNKNSIRGRSVLGYFTVESWLLGGLLTCWSSILLLG